MQRILLALLLGCGPLFLKAQIFSEDFGTTFSTSAIGAPNWSSCRSTSSNSSTGPCAGTGDYGAYISNNQNLTTEALFIPTTGYCLQFEYSFNNSGNFPTIQIGTGGAFCFSGGTTYTTISTLTQTSTCDTETINLDAYAGQTVFIRFLAGGTFTSFYLDDITVDNSGCSGGGGGTTCLLSDDFGTGFASISTVNWPTACRSGSPSSFNTSGGNCATTSDYGYGLSGFGVYITSMALPIPAAGYTLDFEYAFNNTFGAPAVEIRSGGTCGTTLLQTVTLTNTFGACLPQSVNLDAYAGQTIYLRFRGNTSSATFYFDEVAVCGPAVAPAPKIKWADNFNDNDLVLDYPGNDGDEDCATCGPWVLGGGSTLELVPSGGWNGNTVTTEAFPQNMPNVYYAKLDRNEWIESPVMDLSGFESFKISFYAKSSSPGTGGGDTWSFSDRLRLQIWDGSSWQTIQSLRDDLGSAWSGPDDFISSGLPFNYYCFSAYKSTSSPGNYYYTSSPNVNTNWFHSGFKFRVIFEGGFSGSPFAWVDDFTFRADADGYSTMIPCGLSFWNEPTASAYGQDVGTTGNNNAEKGVELELDNSISFPPNWLTEANDGDTVTQVFGSGESERVVFCVISEQEIDFAFPRVHYYAPDIGWQSTVMSKDNNYTGPGWKYYAVEYISCDLASSTIALPTDDFQYYYSFEYGIEFIPVFYQLNTSGIEYGGGVTSLLEVFNAPDVNSSDNCGSPLPATNLILTGEWKGNHAQLEWETAPAPTDKSFVVERSSDGTQFQEIGWVPVQSTTTQYTFLDENAAEGNADSYYYRLRRLNENGGINHSEVIRLDNPQKSATDFAIVPNPSGYGTAAHITIANMQGGTLQIIDAKGAVIFASKWPQNTPSTSERVDLPALPAGIYQIRWVTWLGQTTKKWAVQ